MEKGDIDDASFSEVPLSCFNVSVRLKLSTMLNPELPFFERDGCVRDYRGLAELMGFDNNAIMNFQRLRNPTLEILQAWERGHTISEFLQLLKTIQRYDIMDDLMPDIVSACDKYYNNKSPIQVAEITSCDQEMLPEILTIYDSDGPATFDAYVCYADSDTKFVRWLASNLENQSNNIRLCIRDRDLTFGTLVYDTFVRLVQERCQRILIVLSPEFLKTPECEYQAKYAASLASEHRNRRLIPIVYKPCEIPAILKYISKVDFSRTDIQDWIWSKLIASIKTPTSKLFVGQTNCPQDSHPNFKDISSDLPEASCNSSLQVSSLPNVPSDDISIDAQTSDIEPLYPSLNMEVQTAVEENKSKSRKFVQKLRNMIGSSSSISSASSGFHSQSDT